MANKKKDYRLYCMLLYRASPSEMAQRRYKAGCKIARSNLPSKKCRNCKYGIDRSDVYIGVGKKFAEGFADGFKGTYEKAKAEKNFLQKTMNIKGG